jgi:hypothetical protein
MSKLLEAFLFWLNESKFNPKSLDALASLEQKRQAVEDAGLSPMGEGSSRAVYLLDSKRVLKLATNEQGVEQNRKEQEVFNSSLQPLVARLFEESQDGSWLVSELVRPLSSEEDFEALTGLPWVVVAMFLAENQKLRDPEQTQEVMKVKFSKFKQEPYASMGKKLDAFFLKPWFQEMSVLLGRSEIRLNVNDLTNLEHWGKTADQRVVLLDYGA